MKIRWPRLTFPPINLWTAPHQPALEDTMTEVAERDSVQDQLCSRIDDLEMEKEALAAQLDRAEEKLAVFKSQADALHRIGTILGLDAGADLTREAPARVEALVVELRQLALADEVGRKPCPECETTSSLKTMRHPDGSLFIGCCRCGLRAAPGDTKELAIINWNKRAEMPRREL